MTHPEELSAEPPCHLFFFNDTATTEIYTLSLHDALPISMTTPGWWNIISWKNIHTRPRRNLFWRSEEHTSELQSQSNIVCRLLLEKTNVNLDHAAIPLEQIVM